MAAYIIKSEIAITRQEGDDSEIVITVPAILSLASASAKFQVRSNRGSLMIDKAAGTGLTIAGQVITILLAPADTKGYANTHRWELEITTAGNKIITAGKGLFIVTKELIV